MVPLAHLVRSTRGHFQAFVKFAVAGFSHGLVEVPFGKVAGEMVRRQTCGQCARLRDRSLALVPCGFVRGEHGGTRCGHTAAEASEEAQCAEGEAKQIHRGRAGGISHFQTKYGGTHRTMRPAGWPHVTSVVVVMMMIVMIVIV